jgi:predicted phosphodiesterase
MRRHIFIGDIHGCYDEGVELLDRLNASEHDVVIAVGDLTRKGPAPDRCVDLWKARNFRTVLGNNDAKMLERAGSWRRFIAGRADRSVLQRGDLLQEIARWPLRIDVPEAGVIVVHGGVMPDGSCPRRAALELRYIRRNGDGWEMVPKGKESRGDAFWSEVWGGEAIVVYGHTPRREAKIDRRAIGLDTGCVYGGKLSAAVFERPGEWRLVEVQARRAYSK